MACTALKNASRRVVPGLLLVGALITPAAADEPAAADHPTLSGSISVEVQNDWIYDADDDTDHNELTTTIEPSIVLGLTPGLSLNLGLTLESVRDGLPGEDRTFDDHGLYVNELTLLYETDRFSVYGGKFTPNFGIAWDATPGLYGTDFAEDYELSERLGFGGSVTVLQGRYGTHVVSASAFMADTSFLAETAFTDRDRPRRWKGGPSNTGSLESLAVALDGSEFEGIPGLRYHVALVNQETNRLLDDQGNVTEGDGVADENGFVVALEHAIAVSDDLTLTPLIEWARFHDNGGTEGVERDYLTLGVGAALGNWIAATSYTGRFTEAHDTPDVDDSLYQVSLGYVFDSGLSLQVGWKWTEEEDVSSSTAGILIGYARDF